MACLISDNACIAGPTADWWSVGVILFELLVGIPPFNAEHPQVLSMHIACRKFPVCYYSQWHEFEFGSL